MSAEREEGWESEDEEKDRRVSRAAIWEGLSVRRLGSIVEGAGGSEGRGGRRSALSGGGRRRDSHVCRSICRLKTTEQCQHCFCGRGLGEGSSLYRAICCSRSCILARFDKFIGFGLGNEGSGVASFCDGLSTLFSDVSRLRDIVAHPIEPV